MADSENTPTEQPTATTEAAPTEQPRLYTAEEVSEIIADRESKWKARTTNIVQDRVARATRNSPRSAVESYAHDEAAFRALTVPSEPGEPGRARGGDSIDRLARVMEMQLMQQMGLTQKGSQPRELTPTEKLQQAPRDLKRSDIEQLKREHGEDKALDMVRKAIEGVLSKTKVTPT